MTKLFHIKIHVKKTNIDALFDSISEDNVIAMDLVRNIGLEVHDHLIPYPLGWVNKDVKTKVTKQCKIKFVVCVDFINEMEFELVPLDVYGILFQIPYMYMRDAVSYEDPNSTNWSRMESPTSSTHIKESQISHW